MGRLVASTPANGGEEVTGPGLQPRPVGSLKRAVEKQPAKAIHGWVAKLRD